MPAFLTPLFLWGLAAVAVPVLVHLLGRSKPVPHLFPAMRFLIRSHKTSARAMKLKHLLLLLLRVLVLALLALALARPMWQQNMAAAAWIAAILALSAVSLYALYRRELATGLIGLLLAAALFYSAPSEESAARATIRGDFVIVMDQSMSMGYVEPRGARFDLARRQALRLLDRLTSDSRVALIFATESPERVQGRLSLRHDLVRQRLEQAQPGGRGLDLARALQAAQEVLDRDRAENPCGIVLFTDLQANAIEALLSGQRSTAGVSPAIGAHYRRDAGGTVLQQPSEDWGPLVVVDSGSERAANGAVLAASLPSAVLPADTQTALSGKIRVLDKSRPVLAELFIDEKRVAQSSFDPRGRDVLDADFLFASGSAGAHSGRIHLPDSDRLPLDQDFLFAYACGRPASALILETPAGVRAAPSPGAKAPPSPHGGEGNRASAFFLRAALQAAGESEPGAAGSSGLSLAIETPGELTREKLARHRVVILADCPALSAASWSALQQWTSEGGGLFVWLGPHALANLEQLRRLGFQETAHYRGLLPGSIGAPAALDKPQPIAVAQADSPLLAHLTPGVAAILREARVRKLVKIAAEARDPQASVVLALADGSPLLLEKSYGRGRVLLSAIDPGMEYSDLPRHGEAYVTLVLDCMRVLAGEESEIKARLGQPLLLALPSPPADNQVLWKKPGAASMEVLRVENAGGAASLKNAPAHGAQGPGVAQASSLPGSVTVIVPPLEIPGIQQFSWLPYGAKTPLLRLVAVNAERSESDLTQAAPERARQALSPWQAEFVREFTEARMLGGGADGGARTELSACMLLVLAAFLLAECFLANRMYPKRQ